jgi:hypothetical protein
MKLQVTEIVDGFTLDPPDFPIEESGERITLLEIGHVYLIVRQFLLNGNCTAEYAAFDRFSQAADYLERMGIHDSLSLEPIEKPVVRVTYNSDAAYD